MRPLATMSNDVRRGIRGVLTDIDDTLSTSGRIGAAAYAAMERLHASGMRVVPVTGRPAGWCDHIARMWPVDAVVGENGGLYMIYDGAARKLRRCYVAADAERRHNRARLESVAAKILREVPGCALASDQAFRETDLAIDYREDVDPMSFASAERIADILRREGMSAKISSIHVNGWFGSYDKLSMTRTLFAREFGVDLEAAREQFVFIGDSPNDAPMFDFFPHSVGVANVREFADRIATPPTYVTVGACGEGFAELADFLLAD
jgi:HAD superfamily hydrolase (TIGR01484 family)